MTDKIEIQQWEKNYNYDYIILDNVRYVILKPEGFEQLKTLDENVKRAIKELDESLACEMAVCPEAVEMNQLKIFLESLYKTKYQQDGSRL